ncbi:MAG: glycosyltransferase family 4 protein [Deltaproteobacteria bacterium]|nr:glycosyltransferase family 4 protein [Deltaproteobacteria bacterium]MBI3294454.1 glycosyltransferase family 4 protein [Deltaproteobacteria bacterium]
MRILILTPTIGESYGTEQVVKETGEGLTEAGHTVHFVAGRGSGPLPAFPGDFLDSLFAINSFSSRTLVRETNDRLLRLAQTFSPDIIHLMDQLDPKILEPILARYHVVLTSHTVATTSPSSCRVILGDKVCEKRSGWMCLAYNKRFGCLNYLKDDIRRAHAVHEYLARKKSHQRIASVLGPSRYICDLLKAEGWKNVNLVPNPVPLITATTLAHSPANLMTIASRLVPMKGIDRVLRALKKIESDPWTLWIAGEGPERAKLEGLTQTLALAGRVAFRGALPRTKLHSVIRSSALFLQPNLGPESFGLAAAEASALGIPVVGFDVPGLNETILSGKTGLLAARGDENDIAQKIHELLSDPAKRHTFGSAGADLMKNTYTRSRHIAATLAAYQTA